MVGEKGADYEGEFYGCYGAGGAEEEVMFLFVVVVRGG